MPVHGVPPGPSTADQMSVRRHNLALVLDHLGRQGDRSRARIAAEIGLNKVTVSSLVAELAARGLVVEGDVARGAVGRPGRVVGVAGAAYVAVGVEVGPDDLSVLVLDLRGDTVAERRVPVDGRAAPAAVLRTAATLVRRVLRPLVAAGARTVGLTLAVPGIIEPATGTVVDAPNLGWHDAPAVTLLRADLGDPAHPVTLENEANLAALAEVDARGAEGARDLLLITGGVGVGGGIVTEGRLLRGGRGVAGEVGHLHHDPSGRRCRCGRRGCWETVVGLNAFLRAAARADDPVRDASTDLAVRLAELRRRAEAGHPRTRRAIDQVGDALVTGCGTLVNVLDPEVLVLGGYFAELGPWFVDRLNADLPREVFAPDAGGCRAERSSLGLAAAVRGGALHALRRVYDDPTLAPFRSPSDPNHPEESTP
ncbi:ROK family transcriptional regulator [Nostocoides sp. Soil756]|uniref:ROK family transcriptional regulator n=1 Tax=Nostocoides sp. Soil756 TaxID=1736399 RepID=UPI000AEE6F57|nr:ROK family transcriptional regulator [Tetrasphaera sp. Soil756]